MIFPLLSKFKDLKYTFKFNINLERERDACRGYICAKTGYVCVCVSVCLSVCLSVCVHRRKLHSHTRTHLYVFDPDIVPVLVLDGTIEPGRNSLRQHPSIFTL
jgi:hypothetical protein